MDSNKVCIILNWAQQTSLHYVRLFFRLFSFYQYFFKDFSKFAKPLTSLTIKDTLFDWSSIYQSVLDNYIKMVSKASILTYYKQGIKTIVEIDLSNHVSSRVFSQSGNNELLQFVILFSKNLNPTECNYKIYNKELLAIIGCFEK